MRPLLDFRTYESLSPYVAYLHVCSTDQTDSPWDKGTPLRDCVVRVSLDKLAKLDMPLTMTTTPFQLPHLNFDLNQF